MYLCGMNYLSVEELYKSFGPKLIFEDLTFGISKGQKVAFVAKNGTGKSTLLKVLAGQDSADKGVVAFNNSIRVGFLDQDPRLIDTNSIREEIFSLDHPAMKAVGAYRFALDHPEDGDAMEKGLALMDEQNAWDMEVRVDEVLTRLKISTLEQKVGQLSGGQQKRIALAKLLLDDPDFLILDEPTNHLDLEIIEWLEEYLAASNKTLLMVTHDRYFLERVCNEIIELDAGALHRYHGNYSYYLEKREERHAVEATNLSKAQSLMKSELDWIRKQPRARGTKAKYRVDAFHDLEKKATAKVETGSLDIDLQTSRLGKKILEIKGLKKAYGDLKILNDFNYLFKRKERVGVIGKNGVGKSTFLNMITGSEKPDAGEIIAGPTLVIGYYNQAGMKLDNDKRVVDVVKDIAEYIPTNDGKQLSAGQMLEKFLFTPDSQYSYVSTLSGGEKRRLYLLTILMGNPNFLILDEPTNDLDLLTLNVLEDYLMSFPGCLMVVSHDRYFMDKLVDHMFVFEGEGKVKDFNGRYLDYFEHKLAEELEEKRNENLEKPKAEKVKEEPEKRKLSFKEKTEYDNLEKEIEELEEKKAALTEILSGTVEGADLAKASEDFGRLTKVLDEKTDRWLELGEFAE